MTAPPFYADEAVTLHLGEMLDVLPTLPDASVDAVVCDPPYGLANHHPRVIAETLAAWLAGDRAYVPEGVGFMGRCVHPDTDILTARGWVPAPKVEVGDEVMALNPSTGEIEYVPVMKTHAYQFDGDLLLIGGRSARQLVTPNHMVWTVDDGLIRADQLPRTFGLANQGTWAGGRSATVSLDGRVYDSVAFARFLGLWLGDGAVCHRKAQPWKQDFIQFTVLKRRKVEAIRAACEGLGVKCTETLGSDGRTTFYVYDKPLRDWLSPMGGAATKAIPTEVLAAFSTAALEALYQGLIETDGTRQGAKGQELYFTISEQLADDVQTLCLLTGRSAVKTWREGRPIGIKGRTFEQAGGWVLSIVQAGKKRFWMERDGRRRSTAPGQPPAVRPVPYAGQVHCVTLARHHVMMTRYQGRPVWTGNSWDRFVPPPAAWDECLRVLKPGGHLVAFAAPRTADLMGLSIRLAGFEIRDSLHWIFGSGMPKGQNIGKAIDRHRDDRAQVLQVTAWLAAARDAVGWTTKQVDELFGFRGNAAGHWMTQGVAASVPTPEQWDRLREELGFDDSEIRPLVAELNGRKGELGEAWALREVIGSRMAGLHQGTGDTVMLTGSGRALNADGSVPVTAPATDAARQWDGWNTQLRPAHEPIILARKSTGFDTTVANVLRHGTGALNVDATRTGQTVETWPSSRGPNTGNSMAGGVMARRDTGAVPPGRWPTNVLLAHPPLLDATGQPIGDACADGCVPGCPVAEMDRQSGVLTSGTNCVRTKTGTFLEHGGLGEAGDVQTTYGDTGGASRYFPVFRYEAKAPASERPRLADGTAWPTVKPLELMRWLVRLVTPPGGTVLDWCAGTGTTLEAAAIEGFPAIGIEREQQGAELCRVRLSKPLEAVLFGDIA